MHSNFKKDNAKIKNRMRKQSKWKNIILSMCDECNFL